MAGAPVADVAIASNSSSNESEGVVDFIVFPEVKMESLVSG
jgi:hypothetical protein